MRYRIKFTKQGALRYIAHLDVLRVWQKALKKARVGICYSDGFNPHQKIALAMPLGLGLTSEAEYVDIVVAKPIPPHALIEGLNKNLPTGMACIAAKEIAENEKNTMAQITAALYSCALGEDEKALITDEMLQRFLQQETICIIKKTKTAEKEQNIRPAIHRLEKTTEGLQFLLACGSEQNLKPEHLMQAFFAFAKLEPFFLHFHRMELYKNTGGSLKGLMD